MFPSSLCCVSVSTFEPVDPSRSPRLSILSRLGGYRLHGIVRETFLPGDFRARQDGICVSRRCLVASPWDFVGGVDGRRYTMN